MTTSGPAQITPSASQRSPSVTSGRQMRRQKGDILLGNIHPLRLNASIVTITILLVVIAAKYSEIQYPKTVTIPLVMKLNASGTAFLGRVYLRPAEAREVRMGQQALVTIDDAKANGCALVHGEVASIEATKMDGLTIVEVEAVVDQRARNFCKVTDELGASARIIIGTDQLFRVKMIRRSY